MAVTDLWTRADGTPSARHGRGLRWRVTVAGHPSRAFGQKGQAQRHELRLLHEPPPRESDVTVGEMLTVWQASKAGLAESTRARYRSTVLAVRGRWEHVRVCAVAEHDVAVWLPTLGGSSTQIKALQCLTGALRLAVRSGALDANPLTDLHVRSAPRRAPRYLTVAGRR